MPANLENSAVATGLEKVSYHSFPFQSQRKAMPKNAQTTTLLHSSHTLAKECSKFSRLQQHVNWELPDVQGDLEKAEEQEIKLPTSAGS